MTNFLKGNFSEKKIFFLAILQSSLLQICTAIYLSKQSSLIWGLNALGNSTYASGTAIFMNTFVWGHGVTVTYTGE